MKPCPTLRSPLASCLALAALATSARAADLFVGPGKPFAQIDAAIAAASPGDRIFVDPGQYADFFVDKPLEIRGAGAGQTRVTGFFPGDQTAVAGIGAGETATIAEMSFDYSDPGALLNTSLLEISGNAGTVVLQDVAVNTMPTAYHLGPGVHATGTARLIVQGSTLRGSRGSQFGGVGNEALKAESSTLLVDDTVLQATDFEFGQSAFGEPGAPAAVLDGCDARFARVDARGGSGGTDPFTSQSFPGGAGVELTGSTLVVAGGPSNLLRGGQGAKFSAAPGGPGLRLSASAAATLAADALVEGGLDGTSSTAAPPLAVEAGSTAATLAWNLPALAPGAEEVAVGAAFSLEHSGEPGALVVPAFSTGLGPALAVGGIDGPVQLDLTYVTPLPSTTLDGAGLGGTAGTVPAMPSLAGAHAWFQAIELAGGALRASNPARIAVRL